MLLHPSGARIALEAGEATRVLDYDAQEEGVLARIALSLADREIIARIPAQRGDHPLPSGAGVVRVI
jgi:hypothetical protein